LNGWGWVITNPSLQLSQQSNLKPMTKNLERKVFLGVGKYFIPLPRILLNTNVNQTVRLICQETADLSGEERSLHRYVVNQVTKTSQPVQLEEIARNLNLSMGRVVEIVNKLEDLKVFFYRYENKGINWAYPVTAEQRIYQMSFSSGENCLAA
jgi:hypothetical protein